MGNWRRYLSWVAAAYFVASFGLALGFARYAYLDGLNRLEVRADAQLSLNVDRLASRLQGLKELAVVMARHPVLVDSLASDAEDFTEASRLLQLVSDRTVATEFRLLTADNRLLAASGNLQVALGLAPIVNNAMLGTLGSGPVVTESGRRFFAFAAPVFKGKGPAIGALVVSVDLLRIEWDWPADPVPVIFQDRDGVVVVSNRPELTLAGPETARRATRPLPVLSAAKVGGHTLVKTSLDRTLPQTAILASRDIAAINMKATVYVDVAPVWFSAVWQGGGVLAIFLAFGLLLGLAAERRRSLSERLELEAKTKAKLEGEVEARTFDLRTANETLLNEVHERKEAESALRRAQDDLVQAGKLSALGQMSAGISHELNQPLMAIQSFAENAETFLRRENPDKAKENLGKIAELARAMGRIIKNLRAFARQEREEITDVDLVGVVDSVLELVSRRVREQGLDIVWAKPDAPVLVRGGKVRLQQVVMNLITNAADAMQGMEHPCIEISMERLSGIVRLRIRDSGPGLEDAEKIFDPFYSTKAAGSANGLGLGLSISYGLVQSFGGDIVGRNHPDGGAVFTVDLKPVEQEEVE